jgi:phage protein D
MAEASRLLRVYAQRPFDVQPKSLTVFRREFAHDVIAAVITGEDAKKGYQTGTPIKVEYGQRNGDNKMLCGYVHHTEPLSSTVKNPVMKLVCIGASYVFKEPRQAAWSAQSVSDVVRELTDSVRFSGYIKSHDQFWPTLAQQGKPTWDFMVSLAHRVGWFLYADNTDLQFHPYLDDFVAALNAAQQFSPDDGRRKLITFHAISGDTTPEGGAKANRQLAGVDPRLGTLFSAQDDGSSLVLDRIADVFREPRFRLYEMATVAGSYGEATALLSGATAANRWHAQAKAEVTGNSRLAPGMLVAFDGINRRHDGYWYVQAVEHSAAEKSEYTAHLTLGRDSDWDQLTRPDPHRRKVVRQRHDPFGVLTTEVPPVSLINNLWRAAFSPRPQSG